MKFESLSPFEFARLTTKGIRELNHSLDKFIAGRLWVKILIALFSGIGFGILIGPEFQIIPTDWAQSISTWITIPGQLFLSLIQLVVIPLVFSSVVLGIVSSDSIQQLKSLGLKIGIYYIITTTVAIGIGFAVTYLIQPGQFIDKSLIQKSLQGSTTASATADVQLNSFSNLLTGIIPNNAFNVLASGEMIQVVLLAFFIGFALMSLSNSDAKPLIDLLGSFQKISMTVIGWAMHLAPLAVFGLTAQLLTQLGIDAILGLGVYALTVLLGLFIVHCLYLLIIKLVAGYSPILFLKQIRNVQLLAFSTSSSASVMPLTLETAEKELKVKPSVSQLVIPLGTTVNMDGTALYQGVATLFLAQVFNIDLSIGQLAMVVLTATLSSIGAPGAPGVGMAVLAIILRGVGIPTSGIVLIIGLDRILDMFRTVINVTGDLTAALVMNRLSQSTDDKT